jgi:hypothetical protein
MPATYNIMGASGCAAMVHPPESSRTLIFLSAGRNTVEKPDRLLGRGEFDGAGGES